MQNGKDYSNYHTILRILAYLKPCKGKIVFVALCTVFSAIIGFFQPLIIRIITDQGITQNDNEVTFKYALALLALVVCGQLLEVSQARIFAAIHNRVKMDMFSQAFRKMLHLKANYFTDKNSAEVVDSMQSDVTRASSITDQMSFMMISLVFRGLNGLAGLLVINWKLSLIVLLMVPVKYFTVKYYAKKQELNVEKYIESSREFSGWLSDSINGVREIKLWGIGKDKLSAFNRKQGKILNALKKQTMLDAWNTFVEVILEWCVTCILYIAGGIFVINGTLTIGGAFAFISYSAYVTGPVSAVLNMRMMLSTILPSAKRLFRYYDLDEEEDNKKRFDASSPHRIKFCNVSFDYGDKQIFKNINIDIDPGDKIAIIGPNGSGKTTILNLLLRYIKPKSGIISIGDKDIWSVGMDDYRKQFAVVSQDPYLFFDTVKNNICLGDICEDELFDIACHRSGASTFINRLDKKEDSLIGANGAKLSGGEKQKLAVARAMMKDAPFVILDEATSSYDVESDALLHEFIQSGLRHKTVIIITHKYHQLIGMNKVYEIKDGALHKVNYEYPY